MHKAAHKPSAADDKKLQSTIKRLNVNTVTAVSEVTRSTGRDVTHAMRALRGMRDVFRAIGAALVAAAALLLIATAVQLTRR